MGNDNLTALDILNLVVEEKEENAEIKINILRSKIIDREVIEYLRKRIENLYIQILNDYEGSLFELMQAEQLERWCWQTTESAIVFLDDDAYIERGYIKLDEELSLCFHSWICFKYKGIEYVLDPCLNILCKKSDYVEVYETDVKGRVSAKAMKEDLIRQMLKPKEECNIEEYKEFQSSIKSYDCYNRIEDEVRAEYLEDIDAPQFRNGAGYVGEIDNGEIKKLTVRYYKCIEY